ncbi:MAG: bifunctional UDP-N-acetylglucosamine diphosphorylase/glucosamine-1-phosphate N-acetyltransferase GlmU [Thermoflexales bacterium]|nr:bifunctional UDP-N-acetylglucosamine diphosphorylase/glucosamine-1-phosphate N-acetyltransferase GlmU [Thermoflexales bacterium]
MTTTAIVLAAGKGTRMVSDLPKPLFTVRGKSLLRRAIDVAIAAHGQTPIVVVSPETAGPIAAALGPDLHYALQSPPLGTGHAVMAAEAAARALGGDAVSVLYGDMPLLPPEMLRALSAARAERGAAIAMVTLLADNPRGFGRIVRDANGTVREIVEEVAATPEQRRIRELNVGLYCFDAAWLWPALARITPNPRKGEYFLTDLVGLAVADGREVIATPSEDADAFIGINTRADLADADAALRRRINKTWMLKGVTMIDPATTYIDDDVVLAANVTLEPNTHLRGTTRVEAGSVIGPNSVLVDAQIGPNCVVLQSVVEASRLEAGARMGPFSRIRGDAVLGPDVHLGNFAEVKASTLAEGVKMGHFSYVGDAEVGAGANISAGVVTCNFDGTHKHRTTVGAGALVGSDTMLVAPVNVGAGALTGAGSVVTRDVPPGARVAGVPARPLPAKPVQSQEEEPC